MVNYPDDPRKRMREYAREWAAIPPDERSRIARKNGERIRNGGDGVPGATPSYQGTIVLVNEAKPA